jgi:hypothetical protein
LEHSLQGQTIMLANGRSHGFFLLWMISVLLLLLVTLNRSWGWMEGGGGGGQQSPSLSRRRMFQRGGCFVWIGPCAASCLVRPAVAAVPARINSTTRTTTSHGLNSNNNNNNKRVSDPVLSSRHVTMIPTTTMARGAPATNASISYDRATTIEQLSFQLEA